MPEVAESSCQEVIIVLFSTPACMAHSSVALAETAACNVVLIFLVLFRYIKIIELNLKNITHIIVMEINHKYKTITKRKTKKTFNLVMNFGIQLLLLMVVGIVIVSP